MNWFSSAWHAVTHPSQLVSDGEHWLGQVTDQGAHLVGRGLTDIGLGQVGNMVDGWGDDAANALDHELQLGQTSDPTQLVHGDPSAIRNTATQLGQFSNAFGQTAVGLNAIDTSHWSGAAADAFHAKYSPQPAKWATASDASGSASTALSFYADTVEWAQAQAREAISMYAQGQNVTSAAVTAYNSQVNAYNAAAQSYDTQLQAGQNPGPPPTKPGPFTDPGAALRERAQQMLTAARAQRDREGATAATIVSQATNTAPASPGLWSQVTSTAVDGYQGFNLAQTSFASGVLTGVADIGKFARSVNPMDPWNMSHPAEYLAGLSGTAAGIVHDAVHPQDLVGQVLGGGWGSDPAQAAGKLVPQVALALATDGGGAADAAAGDAADAADAAAQTARLPADTPTVGDPVDVATGDVVVSQADVRLPGRLPLAVGRMHRSSYRGGRWFGRSWASTLDQRLVVTGQTVVFAAEDGVVLCYPRPFDDGVAVLPVAGARWPLARDGDGYTVTDRQAGVVRRFAPRSGFYLSAVGEGELPLVSVTDRAGQRISFSYTQEGAPEAVTHSGGYRLRVATGGGRVTGLALAGAGPDGEDVPLVGYGYSEAGDLAEVVNSSSLPLRFSYDGEGRLAGMQNRNGFTYQYSYDENGRCVRGEAPDGTMSGAFSYDRVGMVTSYTDAAGAVTTYQVTPRGQVAAMIDPLGNVIRFEHDACGRLVSRTDPLGRTTRWSYDGAGNLAGVTYPDGSRAITVFDERNLPVALTMPDGTTWRQDYDAAGNLTVRTGPDGAVTEYSYDDGGRLAAATRPDGVTIRVDSDLAGLPVGVTGPDEARTTYERDKLGRITTITKPDGSVTRLDWAMEGQLLSRTFADGAAEQYTYDGDGNLIEHVDPARGATRFEYGGFGQQLARTEPDGTRTAFRYDQALRLTAVTRSSLTWQYEYDPASRLVAQTDYNGAVTRYRHDAAGQLTARVNAAGQEISFRYDLLGNQVEREADGAVTSLRYDPAGRLTRASGPGAELEFERDAMGRVTAETCNGRTVESGYDAAGRRTGRITPSGAQAWWDYDAAGRPVALMAGGQELRFGYDQAGRETTRELPGGLRLTQEWDAAGRLAAQTLASIRPGQAGGGRPMQHRAYSYRADGCLTEIEDLLSGPRQLTLDTGGHVTAVAGPDWSEQYGYDPAGNITAASWPVPRGPAESWAGTDVQGPREYAGTLLTRGGGVRYEHDACGRITLRQRVRDSRKPDTWRYEWDADDRLTSVTTPDGTRWRYQYDPLGRRIAKQRLDAGGRIAEEVTFTWDGSVVAEQATSTDSAEDHVVTWEYHPGTVSPVTQLTRRDGAGEAGWGDAPQDQVDGQFYAIITDLIGVPAELTGTDGSLSGCQQRTIWGATLWHPGGASTPLRFPGQYYDDESGLHYNYHRYYDPATGRYLSPDPLGLVPAPNPHAYVLNPLILADPFGLEPIGSTSGPLVYIGPDDPAFGPIAGTTPSAGWTDVFIHGGPGSVSIKGLDGQWTSYSADQFAQLLKNDPRYTGQPIRLFSCGTGAVPDGFAQQLSNSLGVGVLAPNDTLWGMGGGYFNVGSAPGANTGQWVQYGPQLKPPPAPGSG